MRKAVFIMLLLGAANAGFAQEKQIPAPVSVTPTETIIDNDSRVKHLLKAADHLEAAGLKRSAEEIRFIVKGGKESIDAWLTESERDSGHSVQSSYQPHPIDIQAPMPTYPPMNAIPSTAIASPQQHTPAPSQPNNHPDSKASTVLLHVSVVEVSLSKLEKLGFDRVELIPGSFASTALIAHERSGKDALLSGNTHFSGSGCAMLKVDDPYFSIIKAMLKESLAKVIAEPTLITESGRAASYHSGGEIALPTASGNGGHSVDYKQYGDRIDFCPMVVDKDTVRLELRGTISELDIQHSTKIDGTDVPGIRSSTFDTALEFKTGYVAVLSGLAQNRPNANVAESTKKESEKAEKFTNLWIIKAEIVDPMQTAPYSVNNHTTHTMGNLGANAEGDKTR
jgi:hypothetical protein